MTEAEQHDAECQFTRSLLCGMIQQAVADLQSEKVFLSRQLNEAQELDRLRGRTALDGAGDLAHLFGRHARVASEGLDFHGGLRIPAKPPAITARGALPFGWSDLG